jgi:zinc/manganese transport system permease protein
MRQGGLMLSLFFAPFAEFEFMRRALAGAFALSLAGAPLGVFLVLRRMSLVGDAMAHAILPGAAIGYLVSGLALGPMTAGGLAAGLAVGIGSGAIARATALREDASLAALYLVSLALGVTLVSLRSSNVDLLHVLFGNVLGLDNPTLLLLAGFSTLTLLGLAVIYRMLVMETVDPQFWASINRRRFPVQIVFLSLVVLNLVAGFHALGTLLSVGLMMLPAVTARLWSENLTVTIALAAVFGALSSYFGLLLSFYHENLPAGPAIVLIAGVFYLASLILGGHGGLFRPLRKQKHLEGRAGFQKSGCRFSDKNPAKSMNPL